MSGPLGICSHDIADNILVRWPGKADACKITAGKVSNFSSERDGFYKTSFGSVNIDDNFFISCLRQFIIDFISKLFE